MCFGIVKSILTEGGNKIMVGEEKENAKVFYLLILVICLAANCITAGVLYYFGESKYQELVNEYHKLVHQNKMHIAKQTDLEQQLNTFSSDFDQYRSDVSASGAEVVALLSENIDLLGKYHEDIAPALTVMSRLEIYSNGSMSVIGVRDNSSRIKSN